MLNADRVSVFEMCPRCGERSFERLLIYSHCVNCNYFENYTTEVHAEIPAWAAEFIF